MCDNYVKVDKKQSATPHKDLMRIHSYLPQNCHRKMQQFTVESRTVHSIKYQRMNTQKFIYS